MKLSFWEKMSSDERNRMWIVSLVACVLIALEIVAFQSLVYVNEYLPATQVIAIALLGIALGGLLSYFASKGNQDRVMGAMLGLFPIVVILVFPVIIRLNTIPLLMMALLTLPYIIGSIIISLMFNTKAPSIVYLFDLCGAGVGAILAVILIPFLREEGSFLFLMALGSIPILLLNNTTKIGAYRKYGLAMLVISGTLLTLHLTVDPFNMALIATADKDEYPQKIFFHTNPKEGQDSPSHVLKYSRGSLMERIDISYSVRAAKKKPKGHDFITWYNGRPNDHVSRYRPKKAGWLDRRLPTRLKLGENPDTLLVGPAAEGLTKPVIALGDGHVDAVEINSAVAGLMMDELFKASGRAYEGFNLTIGDVRTFLKTTDRKYDFITLLNTHRIRTMGHQGPPEYCHTMEAMDDYFDHLKPEGYLVFEERNVNDRADLGIKRMLRTIIETLKQKGIDKPEENILVYEFFVCRKSTWFSDRSKCNRGSRYTMLMIKRSPVTQEEHDHFLEWTKDLGERKNSRGIYRGIEWMYMPRDQKNNDFTEAILADNIYDLKEIDPKIHNMDIVHDDKPFPYDVFKEPGKPHDILKNVAILAFIMVLLPAIATFASRKTNTEKPKSKFSFLNLTLIFYFSILGIGYLLVELVLIQKLQMFLSSPIISLVVVLGIMLIASGIGGYFSERADKRKALISIAIVIVLSFVYYLVLDPVLDALMILPLAIRILTAIVFVAPLAFFMGVPFPYAMSLSKTSLSERHAGLFFGINGAVGAVATPLSVILSMSYGFKSTLLIGGMAYLGALICLALAKEKPSGEKQM